MINWWQIVFKKTFHFYLLAQIKSVETEVLHAYIYNPQKIELLINEKKIIITEKCSNTFCVDYKGKKLVLDPAYLKIIQTEESRKVHMIYWETSFLIGILLLSIIYMIIVIYRDRSLQLEKQDFLAMTTHELKHPVSVLSLILDSLKRKTIREDKIGYYLDKGLHEIKELRKSLENILHIQSLEHVTIKNKIPISLEAVIVSSMDYWSIHSLNQRKRIRYTNKLEKTPFVKINGKSIEIIVNNLIENALIYSNEDVIVTLSSDSKGAYIEVADSGLGFNEEEKRNYNKMFFRSRRHEIQNIPGTGLGHYIIKKLIKKSGLTLVLESAGESLGSQFRVYFNKVIYE